MSPHSPADFLYIRDLCASARTLAASGGKSNILLVYLLGMALEETQRLISVSEDALPPHCKTMAIRTLCHE